VWLSFVKKGRWDMTALCLHVAALDRLIAPTPRRDDRDIYDEPDDAGANWKTI
jgi:hypothetical protein